MPSMGLLAQFSPPAHALGVWACPLVRGGLAEDEEVLVHDEQEVLVVREVGPKALGLGVPLGLDDVLLDTSPVVLV